MAPTTNDWLLREAAAEAGEPRIICTAWRFYTSEEVLYECNGQIAFMSSGRCTPWQRYEGFDIEHLEIEMVRIRTYEWLPAEQRWVFFTER